MQILRVYSVYDDKAEAYLPPFHFPTHGEATRAFIDAAMQEGHKFCKHGKDYHLFFLGHFDDSTGLYDLCEAPENIGRADVMAHQHRTLIARHNETHDAEGNLKQKETEE